MKKPIASGETRKSYWPQNPLFRLLLINGLIGVGISLLVLAGMFWSNIGNLRTLVMASDNPALPVIMLAFGLIITLSSVVMGSAVMMMKSKDTDQSGHGPKLRLPEAFFGAAPVAAPVRVTARPRR